MLGNDVLAPSPGDLRLTQSRMAPRSSCRSFMSNHRGKSRVPESSSCINIYIIEDNVKDMDKQRCEQLEVV